MSFQPAIVGTGLAAWRFLDRTYDTQLAAFTGSSQIQRDTAYFRETIGQIGSAEDLVSDRRLLDVALTAFGLQDDINNRFFVQKVLEDGTSAQDALARRLSDQRYAAFSEAFGFGPGDTAQTGSPGFADRIVARYEAQKFETAVGAVDDTVRIALYAERELPELAANDSSERTKWFTVMGLPPMRDLFETALGLPDGFGQQDIEQQLTTFQDRAQSTFGSSDIAQFSDPEAMDKLVTIYMARAQIAAGTAFQSPAATALTLLQGLA